MFFFCLGFMRNHLIIIFFLDSSLRFYTLCFLSGDYGAAIEEHRQELQISTAMHDVIGRAVANRKIGECYAEMGNIEAALKVSEQLKLYSLNLYLLLFQMGTLLGMPTVCRTGTSDWACATHLDTFLRLNYAA